MTSIVIVQAGLGNPSSTRLLGDQITRSVEAAFARAGRPVTITEVGLRELAHPITDNLLTGFPGPALQQAIDTVTNADGLVIATPTYSGSYSGVLKSFIDVFDQTALRGMPMILAATGGSPRHSLMVEHALRPLFAFMGADPVPTSIFAATADFGDQSTLQRRIDRAATQLLGRVIGASTVRLGQNPTPPIEQPAAAPAAEAGRVPAPGTPDANGSDASSSVSSIGGSTTVDPTTRSATEHRSSGPDPSAIEPAGIGNESEQEGIEPGAGQSAPRPGFDEDDLVPFEQMMQNLNLGR